jgi:hypothetical protein
MAMAKNRVFYASLLSLSLIVIFMPGCVYLTHMKETIFLKNMEDNQKQMQAALDKEEKLYNKLKADMDSGRLKKLTKKRALISHYGEPVFCKPAESQKDGFKESCIYRNPAGGLLTEVIQLDLDGQDRLYSWQVWDSSK